MNRSFESKNPGPRPLQSWAVGLAAVLSCAFSTLALADANQPAKQSPGSTNSISSATSAPQSVFILPHSPAEGKDPFFPRSLRPWASGLPLMTNSQPVTVAVDLHLKALSGSGDHRLALINNHTFEMGEEAEVVTPSGRVRIKCIEIRGDVVLVQVGGERRELRLRSGI